MNWTKATWRRKENKEVLRKWLFSFSVSIIINDKYSEIRAEKKKLTRKFDFLFPLAVIYGLTKLMNELREYFHSLWIISNSSKNINQKYNQKLCERTLCQINGTEIFFACIVFVIKIIMNRYEPINKYKFIHGLNIQWLIQRLNMNNILLNVDT